MSYLKALTLEEAFRFANKHRLTQTLCLEGKSLYKFEDGYFVVPFNEDCFTLARAASDEGWRVVSDAHGLMFGHEEDEFSGNVNTGVYNGIVRACIDLSHTLVVIDLLELEDEI